MAGIGIIGGTFNPIHYGHLIIAEQFREFLSLEKCLFVPANISPFKADDSINDFASGYDRLEMTRRAVATNPLFEVDDFEIIKGGISPTIDTVEYLSDKYPRANLYLLIGSDHAKSFTKWIRWQEILTLTTLCIASRPSDLGENDRISIKHKLTLGQKSPIWLDTPLIDISSSDIRKRIIEKRSIKYLVPESVEEYIKSKKLYT